MFREFHQSCAIPDYEGIDKVCEGKLANYVSDSVKLIHFHGMDIEMANLTVTQPSIKVLKVEVNKGLHYERDSNLSNSEYTVAHSSVLGAKFDTYSPMEEKDGRHWLDWLDKNHKPYNVQVTTLIESPMKMYILNQNHSQILFGNKDQDSVKNVVKFEANLRWHDFFHMLPVDNKPSIGPWKITDFNNVLNENPHFA